MVLGTLGTGKSTFMNRLGNSNAFEESYEVRGVTQEPLLRGFETFNLIDTPGLNDMRIPTADWSNRFNAWLEQTNNHTIDLALMLFCCSVRP